MNAIYRSQLVWVTVTNGTSAAGAFVPFPDQPELNGVLITGVESMDNNTLTKTPDAVPVISAGQEAKCALSLFDGANQRHRNIPLVQLDPYTNAGIWKELVPFRVNWQRSGVLILESLNADLLTIPILVHYRFPGE